MGKLVLFNKPYGVLCQFRGEDSTSTLASFIPIPDVYPAGRLDKDSEGLLLLTDDGRVQHDISHPQQKMLKTYWVQVEGNIAEEALSSLRQGVILKDGRTKPALVNRIDEPLLWQRDPPIRVREKIPTSWIELAIKEGKNRQVRRMTAAVGYPTLRLVRAQVGQWGLEGLQPGQYRLIQL